MFDIFIQTHFSAGHHLRDYPGNCEMPHGHNWHVEVTVRATELDELGMGVDFRTVKNAAARVMKELDHRNLNEHPSFQDKNPSSENLAQYIFESMKEELSHKRYRLYSVLVGETPTSAVIYRED